MGEKVTLINMGNSTALAVKEELTKLNMLNEDTITGKKEFYVSDLTASFGKISNILLGEKIENVNLVDISKYEAGID